MKLSLISAFALVSVLVGCGGNVSVDPDDTAGKHTSDTGATNGTASSTSTTSDAPDSGSDVDSGVGGSAPQNDAGSEQDSGVDGQAPQMRLVVTRDGDVPDKIEACQKNVILLPLKYKVSGGAITINRQNNGVPPWADYVYAIGSKGTPYFLNARLVDVASGETLAGPIGPSSDPFDYTFHFMDTFTLTNGVHHINFVVDLACTEDAPGEFFSQVHAASRENVKKGDVIDANSGNPIDPSLTSPPPTSPNPITDLVSNYFTILAPTLSVYAKAKTNQGWYVGMPDSDIITPPPTPFNDMQKWWMAEYDVTNASSVSVKIIGGVIRQNDPNGDTEDCELVGLEYAGTMLASATKGANSRWVLTEVPGQPAEAAIDPGYIGHSVKGVCKVAVPLSSAAANGAWHGVPRSGHTPQFVLEELTLQSAVDGRTITIKPEVTGPRMLVRKGKPLINWELQDGLLHEGLNTIAKIAVDSFSGQTVGFRQTYFEFHASPGITFDTLGINPFVVNGVEVQKNDTAYVYSEKTDGIATYFKNATDAPVLLTIELRVNVHGVVSGSNVHTTFMHSQDKDATNYKLVGSGPPGVLLTYPEFGQGPPGTSSFIWTDFAEDAQHVPTSPSSLDYYSGYLIPGFAGESIVSAP